jgi:LmeA-like phospholipid-binding
MWVNTQSEMISRVLSPAVRLFLRSRVETIEELELQIQGHDRQILRGYIPGVLLSVREAVYEGLHLGQTRLQGENIRLNIGQVLRGKPLQLLEPIRLNGKAEIDEGKLNRSIESFILANALTDLLILFLENHEVSLAREKVTAERPQWTEISLQEGFFRLQGMLESGVAIALAADLHLQDPQTLAIVPRYLDGLPEWSAIAYHPFTVDLGSDVAIEAFTLGDRTLSCQGRFVIQP